ncbi:MAG: NAD(P)/FAD-dependent oxidoreductase [Vicinamibacteria bacterium]
MPRVPKVPGVPEVPGVPKVRDVPRVLVVGAGAAGLMAAIFAARAGAAVEVVERTSDGGRKILISGGGRCNVLPSALAPDRFVSDSPAHLVRRFLRAWPLHEQREFFETDAGIPLKLEADTGKLFPVSDRARDVRDALVSLAVDAGARFSFGTSLERLEARDAGWRAGTSRGPMDADAVVLATGGLSVPKTGSDGAGLDMARTLGHVVVDPYPALTPLVADPPAHAALAGVSLAVRLRAKHDGRTTDAHGGFLFTHRGYSGPTVLDLSHIAVRSRRAGGAPASLRVQWAEVTPEMWARDLAEARGLVLSAVQDRLPQRLATWLVAESGIPPDRRAVELRREERLALIDRLTSYELPWTGDEGFAKAEVTGGGVRLDEVDPRTLESRRAPGLFLCGEILDAFGPIGGHNFAWVWATGRAAGLGAAGGSLRS